MSQLTGAVTINHEYLHNYMCIILFRYNFIKLMLTRIARPSLRKGLG